MRDIKFRGKREDNGDWVFGSFIPDALEGSNSDLVSWGFIRRYNRGIGKMETIEVGRETVGQYTGLHDKNGKEIYEGDIVKVNYGLVDTMYNSQEITATVIFDGGCFMVEFDRFEETPIWKDTVDLFASSQAIEVIGNIHEGEYKCDE